MMKKILLAGVALAALSASSAFAADLPSRTAAPVAPIAAVPVFTWTGFYVGVNAGYGWNSSDPTLYNPATGITYSASNDGGFVGGGQIGYNYQMGSVVLGIETDLQYADITKTSTVFVGATPYTIGHNMDWFGTVRGRIGFAFDRALLYATGGLAYTDGDAGWTVGGGLEYAITNNLSAKVEGLYVNIDRGNSGAYAPLVYNNKNDEFGVVRAGLNYKFY
jgi:outer membrane immunogenic protein